MTPEIAALVERLRRVQASCFAVGRHHSTTEESSKDWREHERAISDAMKALTATDSPAQGEKPHGPALLVPWSALCMHCGKLTFFQDPPASAPSPEGQDVTCPHGVAMDVHCCNCHSGFLFDPESCVCGKPYESLTMDLWAAICDLPDRTSPEDDPDAAVVTLEELRLVVANVMEERADVRPTGSGHDPEGQDRRNDEQASEVQAETTGGGTKVGTARDDSTAQRVAPDGIAERRAFEAGFMCVPVPGGWIFDDAATLEQIAPGRIDEAYRAWHAAASPPPPSSDDEYR